MDSSSIQFKLKLLIITGVIAGIVSALSGWKFAFVWYIIGMICVAIAAVAFGLHKLNE